MRYHLYRISTEEIIKYDAPFPRDDGQPVIGLDPDLRYLNVVVTELPIYEPSTHQLSPEPVIDLDNNSYTINWVIVELNPLPEASPEASPAITVITQRQVRLWLNQVEGRLATVVAALNGMPEGKDKTDTLIEWEFANEVARDHHMVGMIGYLLSMTDDDIDQAFQEASIL